MNRRKLMAVPVVLSLGIGAAGLTGVLTIWSPVTAAADAEPAAGRKDQQLPQPVVDTHHLMELFNEPYFEMLKKEMQQQPTGDDGWEEIESRGLQAAELMNLVAIRKMAQEHQPVWNRQVHAVRQAGLDLAKAAGKKDWKQTQSAYQEVVRNCNGCHQAVAPDHAPRLNP